MTDKGHSVHLNKGTANGYGATFWNLSMDTRIDGRGPDHGGVVIVVEIYAQADGLHVGGKHISWDDLHRAEEYAKRMSARSQNS